MQVLMMPDYRVDNPYQMLLAQALADQETAVEFPQGYRRVFPLWRALRQAEPQYDVLHLHWINPYLKGKSWWVRFIYSIKLVLDIWLVKCSGIHIVWTVHNLQAHDTQFPRLERWVRCELAKRVDYLIVHHHAAAEAVVKHYRVSPQKVTVIPHGHYRNVYGPAIDQQAARQQLNLPLQGRIYLNFGMLRPYKGIEALLETWSQAHPLLSESTLLIAGKPKDEVYGQTIKNAVSQVEKALLHAQYIDDQDIPLYFSAADVVVLPFANILTSGSLLLAMSYGKPIIAPRIGSIPETLAGAESLLYESDNSVGLLHRLKESNEHDLETLAQQVTTACDQLNWHSIGQKTYQTYQSAISA